MNLHSNSYSNKTLSLTSPTINPPYRHWFLVIPLDDAAVDSSSSFLPLT